MDNINSTCNNRGYDTYNDNDGGGEIDDNVNNHNDSLPPHAINFPFQNLSDNEFTTALSDNLHASNKCV